MTTRPVERILLPSRSLAPWALLACALTLPAVLAACDSAGAGPADANSADSLDDTPAEDVRGGGGTYPESAMEAQIVALEAVNRYRIASGLGPVNEVAALNQSAQAHADCLVANCIHYGTSGLSPHNEDPTWPGYTGTQFNERMVAAGYSASAMSEVIAFLDEPNRAVAGWIRTLYHRLPLLDPLTTEIGYGGANIGDGPPCAYHQYWNADVIDIGMTLFAGDVVVLYPPDGSMYIPTSFDGLESPEPIRPLPNGWPSGTIVTVQFGKASINPIKIKGHRLLEFGTTDIPHLIVAATADDAAGVLADPILSRENDHRTLALYAYSRLKAGTDYTVVIDLERDGTPSHLEWSFKTDFTQD